MIGIVDREVHIVAYWHVYTLSYLVGVPVYRNGMVRSLVLLYSLVVILGLDV